MAVFVWTIQDAVMGILLAVGLLAVLGMLALVAAERVANWWRGR